MKSRDELTRQHFLLNVNKDQLLTVGDLHDFKLQLLFEMKQLIKELTGKPTKQWLKSHEVQKILGISVGTLQSMRNNGSIPFTRIGGVLYYNSSDIYQMMDKNKITPPQ